MVPDRVPRRGPEVKPWIRWIAKRNITALKLRLEDGKYYENEDELRRQLAEQEEILRKLVGPIKRG